MNNEEKVTIETIREEVENEHRFKSVWRGYEKNAVNEYIKDLEEKQKQQIEVEQEKAKAILSKNQQMIKQIDEMNVQIDELREKLKKREATENSVVQKMIHSLKETNSKLMEENSNKKMQIAALEERMEAMREDVVNYSNMLSALDKRLKELLNEKISECNDVIDAWEAQFEQTTNDIKTKME